MRRAEVAAAAAREAALAEIRAAKELMASDRAVGRVSTKRLLEGLGNETRQEDAESDNEEEREVPDGIEVCAHPWPHYFGL